jgi:hypothetical protein
MKMKISDLFEEKRTNLIGFSQGRQTSDPSKTWHGDFRCNGQKLTSLEGSPKSVDNGDFKVNDNLLTSLEHAPESVAGGFDCENNNLTSLEFSPRKVVGPYFCGGNLFSSLEGIHKHIESIGGYFIGGPSTSKHHKVQITSHILGLLRIKGVTQVDINHPEVEEIINKFLPMNPSDERKNMIECQQELIEAGFDEYAQL